MEWSPSVQPSLFDLAVYSKDKQSSPKDSTELGASSELGISHTELSRRLGISAPVIGYSAERSKIIAHENGYQLMEWTVTYNFKGVSLCVNVLMC